LNACGQFSLHQRKLLHVASHWRNFSIELFALQMDITVIQLESRTRFGLEETSMQSQKNAQTGLPTLLTSIFALAFVGGCGGGSSTPATSVTPPQSVAITSGNADTVAAQAYAASDSLNSSRNSAGGLSNLLTGVSVSVDPNTQVKATGLMSTVLGMAYTAQNATAGPSLLTGVTTNYSFGCANGGTLQGSASKSSSYDIKSGDSFTLNANACVNGTETINGSVTISFSNIVGAPGSTNAWSGTVSTMLSNLSVKSGAAAAVAFSGDMSISINQVNAQNIGFDLSGSSLTSTLGSSSLSLSAFRFFGSQVGPAITYTTDFSLSGNNPSLSSFAMTVQTLTPFKFNLGNNPSQGVLVVSGSNKSTMKLTVVNSSSIKLDVDQNGDGVFETSLSRTWAALFAKQ
jgi:hypothetical protein